MNKFMKKIMSKKDGFTLVELIVVIAILAILAGVAVPVYSGYIKKANEAGDTQVVSAVNTALAAAATENGIALADIDAYLTATATPGTKGCTVAVTANDGVANAAEILKDFVFYYGDDEFTFDYYIGAEISETTGNLSTTDPS